MYKEHEFLEMIASCDEVVLYFLIDEMGSFIWTMNHSMAHGRIPAKDHSGVDADVENARRQQKLAVEQCIRFGIQWQNDDGTVSEAYWAWYRMWDGWKRSLSTDEWNALDASLTRGLSESDIEQYKNFATNHMNAVAAAALAGEQASGAGNEITQNIGRLDRIKKKMANPRDGDMHVRRDRAWLVSEVERLRALVLEETKLGQKALSPVAGQRELS